jgi:anti-sigma28 factor (negative regulator of flagellin synthesis)
MKPLPEELKTEMQPQDGIPESASTPHSGSPSEDNSVEIVLPDAQLLREEKLKTIRQAISDGTYDSDALLEKALERMLQSWRKLDEQGTSAHENPFD